MAKKHCIRTILFSYASLLLKIAIEGTEQVQISDIPSLFVRLLCEAHSLEKHERVDKDINVFGPDTVADYCKWKHFLSLRLNLTESKSSPIILVIPTVPISDKWQFIFSSLTTPVLIDIYSSIFGKGGC